MRQSEERLIRPVIAAAQNLRAVWARRTVDGQACVKLQEAVDALEAFYISGKETNQTIRYRALREKGLCTVCKVPTQGSRCPDCALAFKLRREGRNAR